MESNRKHSIEWSKLLITSLIVIIGWFVGNYFQSQRDQWNAKRNIQTEYLIRSYRTLANASWRDPYLEPQYLKEMETAISDIQLFGSKSQIEKTKIFLGEFKEKGKGSLDPLINDLRTALRHELDLEPLCDNVMWFRPKGAPRIQ